MLKSALLIFSLILSQLSFAQTQRTALLQEAFDGLPFFIYASIGKLDQDAYMNEHIQQFSEIENTYLRILLTTVLVHHGEAYKLQFCGDRPCFDKDGKVSFVLKEGQEGRTAVTRPELGADIFVDLKKLNNPNIQMDFIDAIQLLFHEVAWKIPGMDPSTTDSMIAKLMNGLRNSYSTFQVNQNRRVHILALDRPNRFEATAPAEMKAFWIQRQGFEITTFDETRGHFRLINEVRHQFSNPGLVSPTGWDSNEKFSALARNSIIGIEVDRFADSTTVIRIAADHVQTLLESNDIPSDLGNNTELKETVIRLKGSQPPVISHRQGYLPRPAGPAHLKSFAIKNSALTGEGILLYRMGDMKGLLLHLLVRTNRGLLSLPLKVISTDENGPVIFQFDRKLSPEVLGTELIATDIIVSNGWMDPINKVPLKNVFSLELKPSITKRTNLKLKDALVQDDGNWVSMRTAGATVEKENSKLRFVFASATPLQEMTLYIQHSRQVFDPKKIIRKNELIMRQESKVVGPSALDTAISTERETDVIRIDASQMRQVLKNGILEVEVTVPFREAITLTTEHGPFTYQSMGTQLTVKSEIKYGVDDDGIKTLSKIVAVNQNLQNISINNLIYKAHLKGKPGSGVSEEALKEYFDAFESDEDSTRPACKTLLK